MPTTKDMITPKLQHLTASRMSLKSLSTYDYASK